MISGPERGGVGLYQVGRGTFNFTFASCQYQNNFRQRMSRDVEGTDCSKSRLSGPHSPLNDFYLFLVCAAENSPPTTFASCTYIFDLSHLPVTPPLKWPLYPCCFCIQI